MKLLLDNGGDPNLAVEDGTVFSAIDRAVGYDTGGQIDRRAYDSLVHCWMVLVAYGGKPSNGSSALDLFDEWRPGTEEAPFTLEKLKNHKNYSFAITHTANRMINRLSGPTALLVQAVRALGENHVGEETIKKLADRYTARQLEEMERETRNVTNWIHTKIMKMKELKNA